MIRLYNVRKKCTRTLDLTTKWRLTSCNGFLVTVHATLSVAPTKCIKYTRNIGKVDYFQFLVVYVTLWKQDHGFGCFLGNIYKATSLLYIKVSIEGNGLCTSVHYKPTDSHSYLLYSSSHPSHVKNSISYSQFLRLRRLCSDDSDFLLKSEEMCNFFNKRSYPASVVQAGNHRAQQIDRQSALQTSQRDNNDRIPFTLTITQ